MGARKNKVRQQGATSGSLNALEAWLEEARPSDYDGGPATYVWGPKKDQRALLGALPGAVDHEGLLLRAQIFFILFGDRVGRCDNTV